MRPERGTAEIMIMLAISLILFLITSQLGRWQIFSMLLSDMLHSQQSRLGLQNRSINKLASIKPQSLKGTLCLKETADHGRIHQLGYLCYQNIPSHKAKLLIHFEHLFKSALACPLHNQPTPANLSFNIRSRFTCQAKQGELDTTSVFKGNYIAAIESRFKQSAEKAILMTSGSIFLESLIVPRNTLLITLGDIFINQIRGESVEASSINIIAPLGRITIKQASSNITLSTLSMSEDIPRSVAKRIWEPPEGLPMFRLLLYGLFIQSLQVNQ